MRTSVIVVLLAAGALLPSCRRPVPAAPDRSSIAGAVEGFHAALVHGDRAAAMTLLADDAQILESGHRETREEYESGHLAEDIEYAKAVPSTRGALIVRQEGDVAWTTWTGRSTGKFHGNDVDAESAEMMVLVKREAGWQIRAIHWSSHSQRAAH